MLKGKIKRLQSHWAVEVGSKSRVIFLSSGFLQSFTSSPSKSSKSKISHLLSLFNAWNFISSTFYRKRWRQLRGLFSRMSGVVYFILFHCLMEVRLNLGTLIRNPFFSICFCEFHSDKGSSKINKSKDKSLLSLIKSFVLKHGFHLNLKTTVLKRNNSNAHVRSIFWGKAPVGCYQIK